ncbi:unnamed protein product, partial [marine sediment metagenome]
MKNFIHTYIYPCYTRLWVERFWQIKEGDIVVDAGAYLGGFAIYTARKVGHTGKVICFEPDPNNLKVLKKNVSKSGYKNISVVGKTLGKEKGEVAIESSNHFSSSVIKTGKGSLNIVVQTTLDEELKKLNVDNVDLIKMNIEGSE